MKINHFTTTSGISEISQHYPPGTQENNNSFESRDLIMEKGKELECTRRAGSVKLIPMKGSGISFADSDEGGSPYIIFSPV